MHLVPRPSQFGSGYRAEWSAILVRSYIVSAVRALVELMAIQVLSVWVYVVAEHRYGLHLFVATYAINLHTLRNVFYPTLVGVVGVAVFLVGFFIVQVAGATLHFVQPIFCHEPIEYFYRELFLKGER